MVTPRIAVSTVSFIDDYCQLYRNLFTDVRNFESFKHLHVGMISELPRKTLPAIARTVGLKDGQSLHHFLRDAVWETSKLRKLRLWITKFLIGDQEITLCIDETGDKKRGQATDYVARQYIGNLGKIENGIVSVNSYGVVEGITYPLICKIFKPQRRLKAGDQYKTKPELAVEIIRELKAIGFKIKVVLADCLYGESENIMKVIRRLKLNFIVSIRKDHAVWLPVGQQKRYNRWHTYEQPLVNRKPEKRFMREIIFGQRRQIRYYQITKDATTNTDKNSWYIMTNLKNDILEDIALLYSLRNWIEYGFRQVKSELGWADFRLTDCASIERWWEIVMSAYLMVSCQARHFKFVALQTIPSDAQNDVKNDDSTPFLMNIFKMHPKWEKGTTWKSALNNIRLLIQPYIYYWLIRPWLEIFRIPGFQRCFSKLIANMNEFRVPLFDYVMAS